MFCCIINKSNLFVISYIIYLLCISYLQVYKCYLSVNKNEVHNLKKILDYISQVDKIACDNTAFFYI